MTAQDYDSGSKSHDADGRRGSSCPQTPLTSFTLNVHASGEPSEAVKDEAFAMSVSHDRADLRIWLERG